EASLHPRGEPVEPRLACVACPSTGSGRGRRARLSVSSWSHRLQVPLGQPAVALQAARQVRAHGLARLGRLAVAQGLVDPLVLLLDVEEILALCLRRADGDAHALARNDVTPEIFEQLGEPWVAGGPGNGAMEGEVLVDRAFAPADRRLDGAQGPSDGRKAFGRHAL